MAKDLDPKLMLGKTERHKLSLHLMRNHGEGVSISNLGQAQSYPLSESGSFLSNRSQNWLGILLTLNKDQKT